MSKISKADQKIVKEKLSKGASLYEMLGADLLREIRLTVELNHGITSNPPRAKFYSDKFNSTETIQKITALVDLIIYLRNEKLISAMIIAATKLSDFDINYTLKIGESNSMKEKVFLWPISHSYVIDFLEEHLYTTFKANSTLNEMAQNDFQTLEEKAHMLNLTYTPRTFWFGVFSLFVSAAISIYSIKQTNDSELKINELSDKLLKVESKFDSITKILDINNHIVRKGVDQLMEDQRKASKKKK